MKPFLISSLIAMLVLFLSCKENTEIQPETNVQNQTANKEMALAIMQKHIDAISNRDLKTLESTLSPEGNMQLILPGKEIIEKTTGFMEYHIEWFKTDNWTLDSKILNSEVGETMAMVIVGMVYKEPDRNGEPYFNRMTISYDLKKIKGEWYVIKDQMSSIQKSTDPE